MRRTAIDPLRIENALTLDALEAAEEAQRAALLAPPDALLGEVRADGFLYAKRLLAAASGKAD